MQSSVSHTFRLARFVVLVLDADRDLIRSLARRLAEAIRIRAAVRRTIAVEPPAKGGILRALSRSPLVGAELNLERPVAADRKVDKIAYSSPITKETLLD
jgi:hypothetical protein